ncbi:hypothetical protein CYMTET_12910 [Cymbomonas tetramitiformis]|uniref:Uncharacterized protein n=1 Tax=Cymbomonas tetramitiformis TaxID=36881 RepID=A0AAE0GJ51_9CHLO|nr:hypothetical protein CYMTET_12910 [Cymbomonas tetramitiformis]
MEPHVAARQDKRNLSSLALTTEVAESAAYYRLIIDFLKLANPTKYVAHNGHKQELARVLSEDAAAFQSAVIQNTFTAGGTIPWNENPVNFADEDPRNHWSYDGRLCSAARKIQLHSGISLDVLQFWNTDVYGYKQNRSECTSGIGSHRTGGCLWDAATVLSDYLTRPSKQVLAHHPILSLQGSKVGKGRHKQPAWSWEDKYCIELGAGLAAPTVVAATLGARAVATDADLQTLEMSTANVDAYLKVAHDPARRKAFVRELSWDDDTHNQALQEEFSQPHADVVLMADCVYVLDNQGAWGLLMRQVLRMSTPETLIFLSMAQRRAALEAKFLSKVAEKFIVNEVPTKDLHPTAVKGAHGRMHQDTGDIRLFCLQKRS